MSEEPLDWKTEVFESPPEAEMALAQPEAYAVLPKGFKTDDFFAINSEGENGLWGEGPETELAVEGEYAYPEWEGHSYDLESDNDPMLLEEDGSSGEGGHFLGEIADGIGDFFGLGGAEGKEADAQTLTQVSEEAEPGDWLSGVMGGIREAASALFGSDDGDRLPTLAEAQPEESPMTEAASVLPADTEVDDQSGEAYQEDGQPWGDITAGVGSFLDSALGQLDETVLSAFGMPQVDETPAAAETFWGGIGGAVGNFFGGGETDQPTIEVPSPTQDQTPLSPEQQQQMAQLEAMRSQVDAYRERVDGQFDKIIDEDGTVLDRGADKINEFADNVGITDAVNAGADFLGGLFGQAKSFVTGEEYKDEDFQLMQDDDSAAAVQEQTRERFEQLEGKMNALEAAIESGNAEEIQRLNTELSGTQGADGRMQPGLLGQTVSEVNAEVKTFASDFEAGGEMLKMGLVTAAAIGVTVATAGAGAGVGATMIAATATGAAVNVGVNAGDAALSGDEYSMGEGLQDLASGGIAGFTTALPIPGVGTVAGATAGAITGTVARVAGREIAEAAATQAVSKFVGTRVVSETIENAAGGMAGTALDVAFDPEMSLQQKYERVIESGANAFSPTQIAMNTVTSVAFEKATEGALNTARRSDVDVDTTADSNGNEVFRPEGLGSFPVLKGEDDLASGSTQTGDRTNHASEHSEGLMRADEGPVDSQLEGVSDQRTSSEDGSTSRPAARTESQEVELSERGLPRLDEEQRLELGEQKRAFEEKYEEHTFEVLDDGVLIDGRLGGSGEWGAQLSESQTQAIIQASDAIGKLDLQPGQTISDRLPSMSRSEREAFEKDIKAATTSGGERLRFEEHLKEAEVGLDRVCQ